MPLLPKSVDLIILVLNTVEVWRGFFLVRLELVCAFTWRYCVLGEHAIIPWLTCYLPKKKVEFLVVSCVSVGASCSWLRDVAIRLIDVIGSTLYCGIARFPMSSPLGVPIWKFRGLLFIVLRRGNCEETVPTFLVELSVLKSCWILYSFEKC